MLDYNSKVLAASIAKRSEAAIYYTAEQHAARLELCHQVAGTYARFARFECEADRKEFLALCGFA